MFAPGVRCNEVRRREKCFGPRTPLVLMRKDAVPLGGDDRAFYPCKYSIPTRKKNRVRNFLGPARKKTPYEGFRLIKENRSYIYMVVENR